MTVDRAWASIGDRISDRQVLALEQSAIRIPSTTFEEGNLADHLASYMSDAGLDVQMMEVNHPAKPGKRTSRDDPGRTWRSPTREDIAGRARRGSRPI